MVVTAEQDVGRDWNDCGFRLAAHTRELALLEGGGVKRRKRVSGWSGWSGHAAVC